MKIKPHKDYWTSEEITNIVAERTGKVTGAVVKPGEITIELNDLPEHERIDLETYFGADHDLPTVAERETAETHRAELVARIAKVTDSNEASIPAKQVRDAIRALAQLTGVEL